MQRDRSHNMKILSNSPGTKHDLVL